jgi:hypothetical protein
VEVAQSKAESTQGGARSEGGAPSCDSATLHELAPAGDSTRVTIPRALANLVDCLAAHPETGRALVAFVVAEA